MHLTLPPDLPLALLTATLAGLGLCIDGRRAADGSHCLAWSHGRGPRTAPPPRPALSADPRAVLRIAPAHWAPAAAIRRPQEGAQ